MRHHKGVLIGKVYADWCGHCQTLKPEWAKMKIAIKKRNPSIEVIEIEQKEETKLENTKNRVKGLAADAYPTIFKYISGDKKPTYYNGERTSDKMTAWALGNKNKMNGGKRSKKIRRSVKRRRTTKSWF